MQGTDTSNEYFQMAVRFVNQTNRHIFLTGKAGTGKTTFLRYIQEHCPKKMAVVAPTGVAAINAGGVTMHSFFQLPFGPYIPGTRTGWNSAGINVTDQHSLFKNIRFNQSKRELLRELELLVIDEVSMVRADMLDAVDMILRNFRQQPMFPFGGVQVLFIGDLFQLPPVVSNEEWEGVLKDHYKSPFFFDAKALEGSPPLYLELKKIYRQNEARFIRILNNLRNNSATEADLSDLHEHYYPGFIPDEDDHYITLTSHNAKADRINQYQLGKLESVQHEFKGEIKGDFNEKSLPAEMTLQLKAGAQIMFIKNDKGENRRYFNGKIGTISSISKDSIMIRFPNDEGELEVEKEVWKNIRYNYNRDRDEIEEEELGTFKQYPIRLAWAITIHKSQGLTFDRAIIDAGASFAPGQVYVALSRLTSMERLVLYSRIHPHCISTDERVIAFTQSELAENELQAALHDERKGFINRSIVQCFDWTKVVAAVESHYDAYELRIVADKNNAVKKAQVLLHQVRQQNGVAVKFTRQLEQLVSVVEESGYEGLQGRVQAAADYFVKDLETGIASLQEHIADVKAKQRIRKYVLELQELKQVLVRKKELLEQILTVVDALVKGSATEEVLAILEAPLPSSKHSVHTSGSVSDGSPGLPGEGVTSGKGEEAGGKAGKAKKGETKLISLQLFKEGKSISEIAKTRAMAVTTIESHITHFVFTGEVDVKEIVAEEKIEPILKALKESDSAFTSPIKEKLGNGYSYCDIKAVIQYRNRLQQQSN